MTQKAVITGDVVKSKNISDKEKLVKALRAIFNDLSLQFSFDNLFEIYRGDSFQALLSNPQDALRIALLIRLGLLQNENRWDARLGIGLGQVSYKNENIKISNGEAFELSGLGLDEIKQTDKRIEIKHKSNLINKQLASFNRLTESIMKRWSPKTSLVVYRILLFGETQKQIAKKLGVSQSAIQQRLAAADFDAIITYIRYFENNLNL
jgi:hypothetical protein